MSLFDRMKKGRVEEVVRKPTIQSHWKSSTFISHHVTAMLCSYKSTSSGHLLRRPFVCPRIRPNQWPIKTKMAEVGPESTTQPCLLKPCAFNSRLRAEDCIHRAFGERRSPPIEAACCLPRAGLTSDLHGSPVASHLVQLDPANGNLTLGQDVLVYESSRKMPAKPRIWIPNKGRK